MSEFNTDCAAIGLLHNVNDLAQLKHLPAPHQPSLACMVGERRGVRGECLEFWRLGVHGIGFVVCCVVFVVCSVSVV